MLHTTLVPIDLESSGEFIFIRYHDFCNMGGERLTLQVEQTIRTLSKEGNSYSVIVKKLKAEGLDVGKATICRVVNGIGKKREAESNGQKFQVDRPRPVRTPATVSKVKRLATTENPPSQRQLSRMCGTSLKTINNIIHKDLELDTRRKGKVHKLTPFHMKNRATNARKLYEEHLAGSRSEYTATLDEAWMYVTYCNGIRKICYIKRGNQVPDNWVHQCSETFPKGFMVVGVMTGRGLLPLIKVPSKVKVNSEFYIECVLKPVIEQLKDLYPGEMDKVFLHHDKASSHTSNKTQQFLQEMKDTLGLNFIRNSDIPVKSPDASPLDFYGFGMLKQRLFNRRPKTEAGLWKAAQEEWSNVSLSKVKEVFAAWKVRCREIAKKKGKHIEHMKKIHVRKIKVVNGIGKKREAESNGQKFQVDRPRPVRTPATVSKVKRLATTENPPSQRQLSRMCGTSLKTINNIIHKDLELDTRRKGKVHKLTPFHMKNRATNARKLYEEHLAGSRSEYTATLDEAWMYVTYCNGIRKICYIKRGNQVPDNWVHQCSETFLKGFMVVGVMTGRGVLPLIKVPSKVKVNSEFYIECVLKPVIEQLKDLYPGEMDKVFLHHDKASSHTSNKTQQFLQEMKDTLGLNFIRNSDIPVKSPDASPLDFYGFGMLKQRLFNRRPKTEAGLWKAAQEEWSNVSLSKVKEVFAAWKVRCREIAKKKGKHIEHMKKIHVRKI
ncbi:IKK1, partial [Cordylochernes scorpioides]